MKMHRYVAASAREAMRQLKMELGEDAVILSNRSCPEGVEILATGSEEIDSLVPRPAQATPRHGQPAAPRVGEPATRIGQPATHMSQPATHMSQPVPPTTQAAPQTKPRPVMSTLSFQDYVRDRLAQAQAASEQAEPVLQVARETFSAPVTRPVPDPAVQPMPEQAVRAEKASTDEHFTKEQFVDEKFTDEPHSALTIEALDEPMVWRPRPTASHDPQLLEELREVKAMLSRQVETAQWLAAGTADSVRARQSRALLDAGLSPGLIRYLVEHMPEHFSLDEAREWTELALEKNFRKSNVITDLLNQGSICALIGPTGVGKTTTIAKLAARAVVRHTSSAVAMITLDNFRVGAFEQLSVYGKLLGVPVHTARDASSLNALLEQLKHKKAILIDTVGVSQKDERISGLLASLENTAIQKVFVSSASAQGDSIDRALKAYRITRGSPVILTKLDEVERLGPVIDCVVRNGLAIAGLTDGQRVPQDWRAADPYFLIRQALQARPDDDAWNYHEKVAMDQLQTAIAPASTNSTANATGAQAHA